MSLSIKCFEYFSLKSSFIFNRKMLALLGVGLTLSSYEAMGMDKKPAGCAGEIITMADVAPRRQAVPDILAAFPAAKGEESFFSLAGYVHSVDNKFSPPSDGALTNRTNHSNASHSDVELDFRDGNDGDDGVGLTLMSTHLEPDDIAEIDNEVYKKEGDSAIIGPKVSLINKEDSSPEKEASPGKDSIILENLRQLGRKTGSTSTAIASKAAAKYGVGEE